MNFCGSILLMFSLGENDTQIYFMLCSITYFIWTSCVLIIMLGALVVCSWILMDTYVGCLFVMDSYPFDTHGWLMLNAYLSWNSFPFDTHGWLKLDDLCVLLALCYFIICTLVLNTYAWQTDFYIYFKPTNSPTLCWHFRVSFSGDR